MERSRWKRAASSSTSCVGAAAEQVDAPAVGGSPIALEVGVGRQLVLHGEPVGEQLLPRHRRLRERLGERLAGVLQCRLDDRLERPQRVVAVEGHEPHRRNGWPPTMSEITVETSVVALCRSVWNGPWKTKKSTSRMTIPYWSSDDQARRSADP